MLLFFFVCVCFFIFLGRGGGSGRAWKVPGPQLGLSSGLAEGSSRPYYRAQGRAYGPHCRSPFFLGYLLISYVQKWLNREGTRIETIGDVP